MKSLMLCLWCLFVLINLGLWWTHWVWLCRCTLVVPYPGITSPWTSWTRPVVQGCLTCLRSPWWMKWKAWCIMGNTWPKTSFSPMPFMTSKIFFFFEIWLSLTLYLECCNLKYCIWVNQNKLAVSSIVSCCIIIILSQFLIVTSYQSFY